MKRPAWQRNHHSFRTEGACWQRTYSLLSLACLLPASLRNSVSSYQESVRGVFVLTSWKYTWSISERRSASASRLFIIPPQGKSHKHCDIIYIIANYRYKVNSYKIKYINLSYKKEPPKWLKLDWLFRQPGDLRLYQLEPIRRVLFGGLVGLIRNRCPNLPGNR